MQPSEKPKARAVKTSAMLTACALSLMGWWATFADVPDRIRNASREAVDQYAAAATVVFESAQRDIQNWRGYRPRQRCPNH